MDSATTAQQKRMALQEIESWTQYISTHGLQVIPLADLRTAQYALAQADTGVPGEATIKKQQDPLWNAYREGFMTQFYGGNPPTLVDWRRLEEGYKVFRKGIEEA